MKKVLLVEDDKFLNRLYTDLLKEEKYEVTSIGDGKQALKKLEEEKWDLVLLDVMLPGISGFEILDIFSEKSKKNFPIVFLTNLDQQSEDKLQHADEYWIKSNMNPSEFIQRVKKILSA